MKILSKSLLETEKIAKDIADTLKGGEVILLFGDLGAGKTTFSKALGKHLGVQETITSPTFMFLKSYKGTNFNFHHFDLYRAENETEVVELGLKEFLGDGVCCIEWNKFENINATVIKIHIKFVADEEREFEIEYE